MVSEHPPRPLRALAGFSLIELLTVITILAIVAAFALPAYSRSQRAQRQRSATQALEGTLTTLRNFALNGRRVNGALPQGYCLRVVDASTVQAFAFTDAADGSGVPDAPDTGETTSLVATPSSPSLDVTVPVPDLTGLHVGTEIAHVLELRPGEDPVEPAGPLTVCFTPPRATVAVFNPDGSTRPPTTLRFELATARDDEGVLAVELRARTGTIVRRDATGTTQAAPPSPAP